MSYRQERGPVSAENYPGAAGPIPVFNVHESEGDPNIIIAEGPRASHVGGTGIVWETYVEYSLQRYSEAYDSPWRMGVQGIALKLVEKRGNGEETVGTVWSNRSLMHAAIETQTDEHGNDQQVLLLQERTDLEILG